ncbi:hypothetical protein AHAS_Ahas20G0053400 [Arachis hypogaea]
MTHTRVHSIPCHAAIYLHSHFHSKVSILTTPHHRSLGCVAVEAMKAVVITTPGDPEVLQLHDVDDPLINDGEVLIKVAASALNRADTFQRKGLYELPSGKTPYLGHECSGTILAVGNNVTRWKIGDKVCALLDGGGYAEKVAVTASQVLPIPPGVSLEDAASLPEVACTVWSTVFMTSKLSAAETFLVHGGASGIGTFAIQIAKCQGARVFATAGSDEKLAACKDLGADVVINYKTEDFVARVKEETGGKGVDVILDHIGGSYLQRNLDSLNIDGRLFLISIMGGAIGEVNLNGMLTRRLTIHEMKAVVITTPGGPEVLQLQEVEDPHIGDDEVLIRVEATALNRADTLQRKGSYPPPKGASPYPGLECSGTIESIGKNVSRWKVGDQVCALLAGGGYAEKVAVPAGQVLPVPPGISLKDAASFPEVSCTVWSTVFMMSRLSKGETFLIHGGSSGIGTFAIQIAKYRGARVFVTAGSEEKLAFCKDIGADVCINYKTEDFVARVKEETGGQGVDVILDCMGASYYQRNLDSLNFDGRLFIIGFQGGTSTQTDLRTLFAKRLTVQGVANFGLYPFLVDAFACMLEDVENRK